MKENALKDLAKKFEKMKTGFKKHSSLQITDDREIVADGCVGIIACDENAIVIKQTSLNLTIGGSDLKMRNWGSDGVIISGVIRSLNFEKRQD